MSHDPASRTLSFPQRRRRYFVDPQVQSALLRQAVYYWLWTTATFSFVILVYRLFPAWVSDAGLKPGRLWYQMSPYIVASAVLFPIAVFNAIRFSNRFVGPMVRVREALKQLAQGDAPDRLMFRKNDFWADIADDVNKIAAKRAVAINNCRAELGRVHPD